MGESSETSVADMEKVGQNQVKVAPKRIKFQEIVEKMEEDRISELPDCLLLEILSRLPSVKHAIRTGTLSKRWKHLWTWLHTLLFSCRDAKYPQSNFVSIVDKTLSQCRELKLKKFNVEIVYYPEYESKYKNWVRYAINCNVEELNLRLGRTDWNPSFVLDQLFFVSSSFTDLTLLWCAMNPTGRISWKNLRSLSLSCVNLDEDLIENILSGSPLLETLSLGNCDGFRRLNITSNSVKNLVVSYYSNPSEPLETYVIKINAPNILSLTIKGELWLWALSLLNVSSLVKANLHYTKTTHCVDVAISREEEEEMLKGFILKLSKVKELKMGVSCSKILSRLEAKGFVFPSNIKFPDGFERMELGDWSSDSD